MTIAGLKNKLMNSLRISYYGKVKRILIEKILCQKMNIGVKYMGTHGKLYGGIPGESKPSELDTGGGNSERPFRLGLRGYHQMEG